tara:strand:+ start:1964 stop:2167 length:204 start_codon:yes stop_codon:yes gene_type:complete
MYAVVYRGRRCIKVNQYRTFYITDKGFEFAADDQKIADWKVFAIQDVLLMTGEILRVKISRSSLILK